MYWPSLFNVVYSSLHWKEEEGTVKPQEFQRTCSFGKGSVHSSNFLTNGLQQAQRYVILMLYHLFSSTGSTTPANDSISIWEINETYRLKIISAKNVNVAENQKVYVRASIYHGSEPVCGSVVTSRGANAEGATWNEILEFNIPISEIPRAAKLCFVVFGATDAIMSRK